MFKFITVHNFLLFIFIIIFITNCFHLSDAKERKLSKNELGSSSKDLFYFTEDNNHNSNHNANLNPKNDKLKSYEGSGSNKNFDNDDEEDDEGDEDEDDEDDEETEDKDSGSNHDSSNNKFGVSTIPTDLKHNVDQNNNNNNFNHESSGETFGTNAGRNTGSSISRNDNQHSNKNNLNIHHKINNDNDSNNDKLSFGETITLSTLNTNNNNKNNNHNNHDIDDTEEDDEDDEGDEDDEDFDASGDGIDKDTHTDDPQHVLTTASTTLTTPTSAVGTSVVVTSSSASSEASSPIATASSTTVSSTPSSVATTISFSETGSEKSPSEKHSIFDFSSTTTTTTTTTSTTSTTTSAPSTEEPKKKDHSKNPITTYENEIILRKPGKGKDSAKDIDTNTIEESYETATKFSVPYTTPRTHGRSNSFDKDTGVRGGSDDNDMNNEVSILGRKQDARSISFFAQPGILAAVIGGAVVGLLCAILLVMFIVYRMRKKDEGSYALDEPKLTQALNPYGKGNSREFYA